MQPTTIRRRLFFAALALGAAGLAAVTSPAHAAAKAPSAVPPPSVVTSGSLDWGLKASFRSYVTGPIAQGSISTAGGATAITGGFRFPASAGGHVEGSVVQASFGGSVHFTGHGGQLDMVMSDLRVDVSGNTGTLQADVVSKSLNTGDTVSYDDVDVATLDLTTATSSVAADHVTWFNVKSTLTAAGVPAFSDFYPAGTVLDPVSFTLQLADAPGPPGEGVYFPVTPKRLLDSREPTSPINTPWTGGQSRSLTVTGGATTVPAGATAVVLNVTAVNPTSPTHLTVSPAGEGTPLASTVNVPAGDVRPNLVHVKVGTNGQVAIFNNTGTVHVLADVVGYFVPQPAAGGSSFTGMTPFRAIDSRPSSAWTAGETRPLTVTGGATGVPADATAVVANVAAVGPTTGTHLSLWPAGQTMPLASNLNVGPGQTVANLAVIKVGTNGQVNIFNNAGTTHVIVDIVGYYRNAAGGSWFAPTSPKRVLDSRDPASPIHVPWTGGEAKPLKVTVGVVPPEATAVVLNLTGVSPTQGTHITAWPDGLTMPLASNLNLPAGDVRANQVVVKLGPGGVIDLFNNAGSTHLVADVVGYYTPESSS